MADNSSFWISGIVPADGLPLMADGFTDLVELPSQGFNTLTRATRQGKQFLLKGLKPAFATSVLYQQLLRKEFDILVSLNHGGIVQAVGWENVPDLGWCIVEEYVDGVTLRAFLDANPPRQERRKVAHELIDALRYVHTKQVVHRDLKPTNILVTVNGHNVKIIDFGLSDTDAWTILKQPAGTPDYISPEQLQSGTPDCRNDIFSLGVILRQLHAGRAYDAVARRCMRPADLRYPNLSALAADLDARLKRRRFLRTAAAVLVPVAIAALALNAYYGAREQSLVQMLSAERSRLTQQGDSLLQAQADLAARAADSTARVAASAASADGAASSAVNHWIAEGQKSVDARYLPVETYADTLSSPAHYDAGRLNALFQSANTVAPDFRQQLEAALSPAEASIVVSALYAYMSEKGKVVTGKLNHLLNYEQ